VSDKLNEKLIAPCGMNCGICIAFFGYTMSGKKENSARVSIFRSLSLVTIFFFTFKPQKT
jgi:hypothetical protein